MKKRATGFAFGWAVAAAALLVGWMSPTVRTPAWLFSAALASGMVMLILLLIHHSIGLLKERQLEVLRNLKQRESLHTLVTKLQDELNTLGDELVVAVEQHRSPRAASDQRPPRVLLVSSNGAGLGHLVRLLAVRRQLDAEAHLYTLSTAHDRLGLLADQVTYYPSYSTLQVHPHQWHRPFLRHFASEIRRYEPDLVLFDGPVVFRAVTSACRALGVRLVWMRRGMWKPEALTSSVQRRDPESVCDAVIVPGDYGGDDPPDEHPHPRTTTVSPITWLRASELLDRAESLAALGLDPEGSYVLVQLGAGLVDQIDGLRARAVRAVSELGTGWRAVVVRNPLQPEMPDLHEATTIDAFPVSRYFRAFDFSVMAGGYNSVQESVAFGLPSVFVPNVRTLTDDQVKRVHGLVTAGLAESAVDEDSLGRAIQTMADPAKRSRIQNRLNVVPKANGAAEAADWLKKELMVAEATKSNR